MHKPPCFSLGSTDRFGEPSRKYAGGRTPFFRGLLGTAFFALALLPGRGLMAQEQTLHQFSRQQLTGEYYSEGANAGDFNGDGVLDVVYGPYWFAGPDFHQKHEIYAPQAQNRDAYADHFFAWTYDFNRDRLDDIFVVGFPGTPAYVYQNPGAAGGDKHWPKHEVFDWVSNESPHFTNLVGDERPELICTREGFFGYATVDWQQPWSTWKFHPVSDKVATERFGHGLGVGDVDGDGNLDILAQNGWFRQPTNAVTSNARWQFFPVPFAAAGGAEMYAYDVDGDGDNDVITSLAAHEFGLAWYEQTRDGKEIKFQQHLIMGSKPEENAYGVLFSELHSVQLADIDGDGLKDIVTGKTYWSHHRQSPMWDAGAVVYWFKLNRTADGVDWIPYRADDDSGIGRQVITKDLNQDGWLDIVLGGMKGCHVLHHQVVKVDQATWLRQQPTRRKTLASGLPPQAAAAQMTVPPGFQVQLAAGEPDVHQPVAFAIDARGRVWVAEAYTYPIRAPEGEGKDKIIIFEDTDGDGTLDQRRVFMEGLNLISGLEVGFDGVWVGAAPYLMFIPDADHDDQPDGPPRILLDGFGYQDTHETLNGFNWGPDGWLYGCHGVFTHSNVGPPGTPDNERTPMNAAIWRYHPTRHEFEVFAWGTSNPWGVDFNDRGQAFCTACVIPHLYHVIQGARYQRQAGRDFNPYIYDDIKTIADHAHYVGNIADHAWWGHEPELQSDTSAAGGGHAHAGAMIYLGNNWPAEYRDQLFMLNIHGNRMNNDLLIRKGSGFVGQHGRDLMLANDRWFRGINLKSGPDGGVYVIDWYDRNACHRANPEIWDRTNGRIYKLTYGSPQAAPVDLSRMPDSELVGLVTHPNEWHSRMARRELQRRGGSADVRAALVERLRNADSEPARLRALWSLHVTAGLTDPLASQLLQHPDEYVRAWTIQLILEDRQITSQQRQLLRSLAESDESPVVRLYLASALQRLPLPDRWDLAEQLVLHAEDVEDHNLPLMLWYGIEPLVTANPTRALQLAAKSQIPWLRRYILRRTAAENSLLPLVVEQLHEELPSGQVSLILDEMLDAFSGRVGIPMPATWNKAFDRLADNADASIRDKAEQIAVILGDRRVFPRLREVLGDPRAEPPRRLRALEILVRGQDADAAATLLSVARQGTGELRSAAIRALAGFASPDKASTLLAIYGELGDSDKRDLLATLLTRPQDAMELLAAIGKGTVPRTDLHAYHVRQLLEFNDDAIRQQIEKVWGAIRETSADKQLRIGQLKSLLTADAVAKADPNKGRELFNKTCATCHTLFGEGGKVGPDITGSNRADLNYILDNIVDPSAVLGNDYRMTVLETADGRIISGLVQQETDSALTIRTLNDTLIIAKDLIESRQISLLSLMPDGLLDQLAQDEIRDLIAYLASPVQVPLRGPPAPLDAATGQVPDAWEGEAWQKIKTSRGTAAAQGMAAFAKDRWSGASQLWWTGGRPGDSLELPLNVAQAGNYTLETVLTRAADYAIVQLLLDDQPLGGPIDLYDPDVITSGVLSFNGLKLSAGAHQLRVTIAGANPQAVKAYMFGLDYLRLVRASE